MIDQDIKDTTDLGPDPLAEPPKPTPQRGKRGWFLPGNTASKGPNHRSPHASKVVAVRSIMFEEMSPDRVRKIIRSMIVEATGLFDHVEHKWIARPSVKAAEFLFDRTIGKPVESSAEDRLKRIEESLGLDDSLDPARVAEILTTAYEQGDNGPAEDAA